MAQPKRKKRKVTELTTHHLNKRRCILFYINILVATETLYTLVKGEPQQVVGIYIPVLHSIDGPASRVQPKSGIQRPLLNGEVPYGSLYLPIWVIFHCFYRIEGLPLTYKSTQVCDTRGWAVKTAIGSRNSLMSIQLCH